MKLKRIHLLISGYVQGVGFRYKAVRWANEKKLVGWVRNTEDGKVEIVVEGENDAINEFVALCGKGPSGAKVENVEVIELSEATNLSFTNFEIRH